MKKILFAIIAMVSLYGVAQEQHHTEFRWHGIYVVGDLSYGFNVNRSLDEFDTIPATLNALIPSFSVGYQFRKETSVGLGFSYVGDPTGAYTQMPIFAELRSHITRSQLTPYIVMQVGYTLPLGTSSDMTPVSSQIEEGGLYFGLEAGGRYAINRNLAVGAHVGYRLLQSNSVKRTDVDGNPILAIPVVLHVITGGISLYYSN